MGLGSYPAVDLEGSPPKVRAKPRPWSPRASIRALLAARNPRNLTFHDAAEAYLVEALPRYPSAKSKFILARALRVHAPPLHDRPVLEIGTRDRRQSPKVDRCDQAGDGQESSCGVARPIRPCGIDMEDRGVVMRNPLTPAGLKAAALHPSAAERPARGLGSGRSLRVRAGPARYPLDRRAPA